MNEWSPNFISRAWDIGLTMDKYRASLSDFGCRLKLSDTSNEITSAFSTYWLGKLKQVTSLSKMTDSDQVLLSYLLAPIVDDFSLGVWIRPG